MLILLVLSVCLRCSFFEGGGGGCRDAVGTTTTDPSLGVFFNVGVVDGLWKVFGVSLSDCEAVVEGSFGVEAVFGVVDVCFGVDDALEVEEDRREGGGLTIVLFSEGWVVESIWRGV